MTVVSPLVGGFAEVVVVVGFDVLHVLGLRLERGILKGRGVGGPALFVAVRGRLDGGSDAVIQRQGLGLDVRAVSRAHAGRGDRVTVVAPLVGGFAEVVVVIGRDILHVLRLPLECRVREGRGVGGSAHHRAVRRGLDGRRDAAAQRQGLGLDVRAVSRAHAGRGDRVTVVAPLVGGFAEVVVVIGRDILHVLGLRQECGVLEGRGVGGGTHHVAVRGRLDGGSNAVAERQGLGFGMVAVFAGAGCGDGMSVVAPLVSRIVPVMNVVGRNILHVLGLRQECGVLEGRGVGGPALFAAVGLCLYGGSDAVLQRRGLGLDVLLVSGADARRGAGVSVVRPDVGRLTVSVIVVRRDILHVLRLLRERGVREGRRVGGGAHHRAVRRGLFGGGDAVAERADLGFDVRALSGADAGRGAGMAVVRPLISRLAPGVIQRLPIGKRMRIVSFHSAAYRAGIVIHSRVFTVGGGYKRRIGHSRGGETVVAGRFDDGIEAARRAAYRTSLMLDAGVAAIGERVRDPGPVMVVRLGVAAVCADAAVGIVTVGGLCAVGVRGGLIIGGHGQIGRHVGKRGVPRAEEVIMVLGVIRFLKIFGGGGRGGAIAEKHRFGFQRIAENVLKGNSELRLEFRRDRNRGIPHSPADAALIHSDERHACSRLDVTQLISILVIDLLIEIHHVVGALLAVHVNVCREEVDIIPVILPVQHGVHIKVILISGPLHVEISIFGMNICDIICFLFDYQLGGRPGNAELNDRSVPDRLTVIITVIPVAGGKAGAGDVRRVIGVIIYVIHIDVRSGVAILEPELETEQIPVPVENGIIVGRGADLHAPGILAVVAGEAGGIDEIIFADPCALCCAHADVIFVIDVIADVAAVGDDRKGTRAGNSPRVIGIGDVIGRSAVLNFTDQAAVVTAAGDGTPVEAVRHIRVIVGRTGKIAGLSHDAAVCAVFVVVVSLDGADVEAAADKGMMVGVAQNTAGVVIRLDGAEVPALLNGRLRVAAIAVDAAGGVGSGGDIAAVAAVIENVRGGVAVAENTADRVFALYLAVIIAVSELLHVVLDFTEDTARVVVGAGDAAVVDVVFKITETDVGADDTARILSSVDVAAVDAVRDLMPVVVRINPTGDTAGGIGSGFDVAGIGTAGKRHLFILTLGAVVAEDTARARVGADFTGVRAVDEGGLVVLDPARDAARVRITRIDLAGVGAAICDDAAL